MSTIGIDVLIYAQTGTDGTTGAPILTKLGGQRGATLNRSRDTLDITNKDNTNFKQFEAGFAEWSIDCDGILIESDTAYGAMEDAFLNRTKLVVRFQTKSSKFEGSSVLVDFPIEAPYEDAATYKMKFQGTGDLTKVPV